jgi:hypothetical protein
MPQHSELFSQWAPAVRQFTPSPQVPSLQRLVPQQSALASQ